tara:strand:- start:853 stop:1149 length:297 start_codon:yes stop_codon:yes gene_type:complete
MAILLVASFLAPTAIKLWHSTFEHKELKCVNESSVHFHSIEINCDFQKFNIAYPFLLPNNEFAEKTTNFFRIDNFDYYTYLSTFQKLHFSLRGPPAIT